MTPTSEPRAQMPLPEDRHEIRDGDLLLYQRCGLISVAGRGCPLGDSGSVGDYRGLSLGVGDQLEGGRDRREIDDVEQPN